MQLGDKLTRRSQTPEHSNIRLRSMPLDHSVREAFLLGREGIRQVVLDPLLPKPLVDEEKRSALVGTLRDYCDKGLNLWTRFLDLD